MYVNDRIVIIGAGLSGLSLSLQLLKKNPNFNITIIDRANFPLDESTVKVGESSVEMGAHYYANVIGLKAHLKKEQLPKLGLRYFFPYNDNSDITLRYEMGSAQLPTPVPSYQIDRGRFENYLYEKNMNSGVEILQGCRVKSINLKQNNQDSHAVEYIDEGEHVNSINARWLVDASGRSRLLSRKLHLTQPVTHKGSACWFRIDDVIDIDKWQDKLAWQKLSPKRERRFSTNHLMGKGYWVWLIPLSSKRTSVGIVYDPEIHKHSKFDTYDHAINWLEEHEPELAAHIRTLKNKTLDYKRLKEYSHSCKQLFSTDGWYITGEAGVFADPFYSPGNDFIGLGNTYITDLIWRDSQDEDLGLRVEQYNKTYLDYYDLLLTHFSGHYKNFGNTYLMIEKILWDTICAFAIPYFIFIKEKFCDMDFMAEVGNSAFAEYKRLTESVQYYFKQSNNHYDDVKLSYNFLNFSDLIHSPYYGGRIYKQLYRKIRGENITKEIKSNLVLMNRLADRILKGKSIIPDCYIMGTGNVDNIWRMSKSTETLPE